MSVSKSFTAVGVGPELFVANGESFTYDVSGTFVGTVQLQQFSRGGWTVLATATDAASGTLILDALNKPYARLRFQCTAFTSGTIVTALTDPPGSGDGAGDGELLFNDGDIPAGASGFTWDKTTSALGLQVASAADYDDRLNRDALFAVLTVTDVDGDAWAAMEAQGLVTDNAGTSPIAVGLQGYAKIKALVAPSGAFAFGVESWADTDVASTQDISGEVVAYEAAVRHSSLHLLATGIGLKVESPVASGTITDYYGIRIAAPSILSGHITNAYGLSMGDQTAAGSTLNFAIDVNTKFRVGPDGSFIEGVETTEPAAPAANRYRLWAKDVGGKTALMVRFPSGASQQITIEP